MMKKSCSIVTNALRNEKGTAEIGDKLITKMPLDRVKNE